MRERRASVLLAGTTRRARREEGKIRALLGLWVSEHEPSICRAQDGALLGLSIDNWPAGATMSVLCLDGVVRTGTAVHAWHARWRRRHGR